MISIVCRIFLSYDVKGLTAEENKHYRAAAWEQLAFAPGDIYKEVKIGIINTDNSFEGNKTFQVIFSSFQRSVTMKGPQQVNVTIMYTKGKRKFFLYLPGFLKTGRQNVSLSH